MCYLVSDAPAEHHVRVHPLVQVQAHLGQFGSQDASFDQVGLSDVRHIPQTTARTQTHTHTQTLQLPRMFQQQGSVYVSGCAD